MRTISLAVLESDYEAFKEAAKEQGRSAAQLIREAMTFFRQHRLQKREPLRALPVLSAHRPIGNLPSRAELYDEVFEDREDSR
jgi:hypothetical protein